MTTTAKTSGSLAAGTTTVKAAPSRLNSLMVISDGTNAATAIVYDNTAGSGIVLAQMLVPASIGTGSISFANPVRAETGITVVVSGTGTPTAVISYDA